MEITLSLVVRHLFFDKIMRTHRHQGDGDMRIFKYIHIMYLKYVNIIHFEDILQNMYFSDVKINIIARFLWEMMVDFFNYPKNLNCFKLHNASKR